MAETNEPAPGLGQAISRFFSAEQVEETRSIQAAVEPIGNSLLNRIPPPRPSAEEFVSSAASPVQGTFEQGWHDPQGLRETCEDGWLYHRNVPEVALYAEYVSRHMFGLRIYAGEIGDDGEICESDNPKAQALVSQIRDDVGEQSSLMRKAATSIVVAGEFYLVQFFTERGTHFKVMSTHELVVRDAKRGIYEHRPKGKGGKTQNLFEVQPGKEPVVGQIYVWRVWDCDPEFSELPTSPVIRASDLLGRIMWLDKAAEGKARNRFMSVGLVALSGLIEDNAADMLQSRIIEAVSARIDNPESAVAGTPIIVGLPDGGALQYVSSDVQGEKVYQEMEARTVEIERLASSFGVPVAALLGRQDATNHWSLQGITEEGLKATIPIRSLLLDGLTAAYLRPQLEAAGVKNPERFIFAADDSGLVTKPDNSQLILKAHERRAISDSALRRAVGATEKDAPTIEDWTNWERAESLGFFFTEEIEGNPPGVGKRTKRLPIGNEPTTVNEDNRTEPTTNPGSVDASANGNCPDCEQEAVQMAVRSAVRMAISRGRQKAAAVTRNEARKHPEIRAKVDAAEGSKDIVADVLSDNEWSMVSASVVPEEMVRGAVFAPLEEELSRIAGENRDAIRWASQAVEAFTAESIRERDPFIPKALEKQVLSSVL